MTTGDGNSQLFRRTDGQRLEPQAGYHSRLERTADGYDFVDKAGNRSHFVPVPGSAWQHRLAWIAEPHGDRVALIYDDGGRLVEAREELRLNDRAAVVARSLSFAWTRTADGPRIQSATAPGLGVSAEYEYDAGGRLRRVLTRDEDQPRPREERFEYRGLGSNLTRAVRRDGQKFEYSYRKPRLREVIQRPPYRADEFLERLVVSSVAQRRGTETRFEYERRDGVEETLVVSAAEATRYQFDARGLVVAVTTLSPQGKPLEVTRKTWSEHDVLQLAETGPGGSEARWEYDARGNRTREERREGTGKPTIVTTWGWDPAFNRVLWERGSSGEKGSEIDPRSGDVIATTGPDGRTTRRYDEHGQLLALAGPDGRWTRYSHHDSYGNPWRIEDAEGRVSWRAYDLRGRAFEVATPAPAAKKK